MHHKRRRKANARAGCKFCKPWKRNHAQYRDQHIAVHRADAATADALGPDYYHGGWHPAPVRHIENAQPERWKTTS